MAEEKTKYCDKAVPLSNWDVAYAIHFDDVNQAIKHLKNVPKGIQGSQFIISEGILKVYAYIEIQAEYSNWSMIGSESGTKLGALVKLKNLNLKVTMLKPVLKPTESPKNYDYEFNEKKYRISKEEDEEGNLVPQITIINFEYEVGVPLRMGLRWYESVEGDKFHLKSSENKNDIDISDKFIAHPNDFDLTNGDPVLGPVIKLAIKTEIEHDVVNEFDHIFATIDYTHIAEKKAKWLKLMNHAYCVSSIPNPNVEPNEAIGKYNYAMDTVKGYNSGTLIIVGMTGVGPKDKNGNLIIPPSIPSDLVNIIPEGCKAGFAYNDNLIIQQLIQGCLKEMFDFDENKFGEYFKYNESRKTLKNSKELKEKNETKLDFSQTLYHPTVRGIIPVGGFFVSIDSGLIHFKFVAKYTVSKGILGFGLPYDVDILQTVELDFEYKINDKGVALMEIVNQDLSAEISPKYEESSKGFWGHVADFGLSLAENLVIMGLTMGMMWAGKGIFKGVKKGTTKVFGKGAKGEIIEIETAARTEAQATSFVEKNATEISKLEKSEILISESSEESLIAAKKEGKVAFSESGKSILREIILFTICQTMVVKGRELYQANRLASIKHDAMKKEFYKFLATPIGTIKWANQNNSEEEKLFVVKEGGLTEGSFVVGLDLDFNHA